MQTLVISLEDTNYLVEANYVGMNQNVQVTLREVKNQLIQFKYIQKKS